MQDEAEKKYQHTLYLEQQDLKEEIKISQLERKGSLGEIEREELRKEYEQLKNKKTSPTHSDPELERDKNKYFPYSSSSNNSSTSNTSSIYISNLGVRRDLTDSTETITPETIKV
jgi:hypothetical protein